MKRFTPPTVRIHRSSLSYVGNAQIATFADYLSQSRVLVCLNKEMHSRLLFVEQPIGMSTVACQIFENLEVEAGGGAEVWFLLRPLQLQVAEMLLLWNFSLMT